MSNMAPDLSGLDPFITAYITVAVIGALISLVIIGQSVTGFVTTNHRTRVARRESIPVYYRRLITTH